MTDLHEKNKQNIISDDMGSENMNGSCEESEIDPELNDEIPPPPFFPPPPFPPLHIRGAQDKDTEHPSFPEIFMMPGYPMMTEEFLDIFEDDLDRKVVLKTVFWSFFWLCLIVGIAMMIEVVSFYTTETTVAGPSGAIVVESYSEEEKEAVDAPEAQPDENAPQLSTTKTPEGRTVVSKTASEVYQKVSPSVVCITSYKSGGDFVLDTSGEGSGIVVTENGYIATNSHVVNDSKKTGVLVTFPDEKQYLATIIGIDKKTDLAILKINASGLHPVQFADSDELTVGQESFAIGNPGGADFSNSLTKGTISALNRILGGSGYVRYIQTDAAINPGNSGGALINEYGQVIGMNTAKIVATDFEGMGFAIPSNTVIEIVNNLIRYGCVKDRGTLNISIKSCNLYMSKVNNVPRGVLITEILSKSPLLETDAANGDIIISVNGHEIQDSIEFIDEIKKYHPDDIVTLKLYRPDLYNKGRGYSFDVKVKLIADTGQ